MLERSCSAGPALIAVSSIAVLLTACWQSPTTGPGEIHWDREACEHCQMVISNRRHAVQIRALGERRTHAFDDLGCALLWLDDHGLHANGEPGAEVWVRDPVGPGWINGHDAHFEDGLSTPMAYGFSAAERGLSLGEVQLRVREAERRRRSP